MAVDDLIVMNNDMSLGFKGGPNFLTSIVTLSGGLERRNGWWPSPRHEYTYEFSGRSPAQLQALKSFFIGRRGQLRTWLLYDWLDHDLTEEPIGVGDGAETDFQLIKTYDEDNPWVRNIQYPNEDSLVVFVDGFEAEIAYVTNGTVALVSPPPSSSTITATCVFYVPVRFTVDLLSVSADQGDTPATGIVFGGIAGLGAIEVLS